MVARSFPLIYGAGFKDSTKEMAFIENTKTVDYRIDMLGKQGRNNLEKENRENQLKETAATNPIE